MEDAAPTVVDALIAAFGGLTPTARALGHKHVTTVDGWRRSGRVPSWRWPEVLAGAKAKGVGLPEAVLEAARLSSQQPVGAEPSDDSAKRESGGDGPAVDAGKESAAARAA